MKLKKQVRAKKSDLEKCRSQYQSIQFDLGVDLMTGNLMREKCNFDFKVKEKDLARSIECLRHAPEQRSKNQLACLIKVIQQMQFFGENIQPLTEDEAVIIAKRLKYKFLPKGEKVRKALDKSTKMMYIMAGKVVCSLPQESYLKEHGQNLEDFKGIISKAKDVG